MAEIKLTYFDNEGRAEVARWILKIKDVDFQDIRLDRKTWHKENIKTPFNQLPILEIHGDKLAQSDTICRFLAHKFGLAGENDIEHAKVDMICDAIREVLQDMPALFREQDMDKRAFIRKKIQENHLMPVLNHLEKYLHEKGNRPPIHFVGDKLTLADLYFTHWIDWLAKTEVTKFEIPWLKYPLLKLLTEEVKHQPKLARWLKSRPESPM